MKATKPAVVLAAGVHRSASTWLFNILRALMPDAGGLYSDTLDSNVLDGAKTGRLVIKSHNPNQELRRFAQASGRIVVTTRDPRDVLVSAHELFGWSWSETLRAFSRSQACLSSLAAEAPVLLLNYDEGLTENPETVQRIADFIGKPIALATAERLVKEHASEVVRANIAKRFNNGEHPDEFDPETQWHPGHVVDGRSGKFHDRLPAPWPRIVEEVCGPFGSEADLNQRRSAFWRSSLFSYGEVRPVDDRQRDLIAPGKGALLFGPTLHLPEGEWSVEIDLGVLAVNRSPGDVRVEVFDGASVLAEVRPRLPLPVSMNFAHSDASRALEIRMWGESVVPMSLKGVRLTPIP